MRLARLLSLSLVIAGACGGTVDLGGGQPPRDDPNPDPFANEIDPPLVPATKLDILFVVDNSASMAAKQAPLAQAAASFLHGFARPRVATVHAGALTDPARTIEVLAHRPIEDIHVGVISSSLGDGVEAMDTTSVVCSAGSRPHTDDRGHLRTEAKDGTPLPNASRGFLAYAPNGGDGVITDLATLEADATALIEGVGQTGCGIEAQLESMYRFLIQPDPPRRVELHERENDPWIFAEPIGFDAKLLRQRAEFLRPDSAVVIVMLTDEDDSLVDPRGVDGLGWWFAFRNFPGSRVHRGPNGFGTTAPRPTSVCAYDPASSACTSCMFAAIGAPDDPPSNSARNDPVCAFDPSTGEIGSPDAYYGATEESINVRFVRMKERFGVDPQFPIERYVRGLTNRRVPDYEAEHRRLPIPPPPKEQDGGEEEVGTESAPSPTPGLLGDGYGAPRQPARWVFHPAYARYEHAPTCTNPLFAAALPTSADDELCALPEGGRSRRLVTFALIGGVPRQLLSKPQPTVADWTKIVGRNPDAYDHTGIDPHMIQSTKPRPGLPPPSSTPGDNGPDPIHGREWNTKDDELQYACTFALPSSVECKTGDLTCGCSDPEANRPLCGPVPTEQVREKAQPSIRPLRVAKGLGDRAIVGSICDVDPVRGYGATLSAVADKVGTVLAK